MKETIRFWSELTLLIGGIAFAFWLLGDDDTHQEEQDVHQNGT